MSEPIRPYHVRVSDVTRAQIRHGAVLHNCTENGLVDQAVAEFMENHREVFAKRIAKARRAIQQGDEAVVRYVLGEETLA